MKLLHVILLLVPVAFTSCVQKTLHDPLAKVSVKINWDQIEDDNTGAVTVRIVGKSMQVTRDAQPVIISVPPGNYGIYAFNTPPGIIVEDDIANMDSDKNGYVIPNAGVFYSASGNITAESNHVTEIELTPVRCMRRLAIALMPPPNDTIESTTGLLCNIARSFNIQTTKEERTDTTKLVFLNDTCYVDLFGVVGESQAITLRMTTNRGVVKLKDINVSSLLSDFNTDKSHPKEIMIEP